MLACAVMTCTGDFITCLTRAPSSSPFSWTANAISLWLRMPLLSIVMSLRGNMKASFFKTYHSVPRGIYDGYSGVASQKFFDDRIAQFHVRSQKCHRSRHVVPSSGRVRVGIAQAHPVHVVLSSRASVCGRDAATDGTR